MPEFRDRYDTAAVSGRISQPPFAELARRGRRRANRTRTVRLAGVVAVAALAAAPLLTLAGGGESSTPAASAPPSDDEVAREITFLDLNYGIVNYFYPETCQEWVAVTEDGGSTWSELREVPTFPGEEEVEAELHCLTLNVIPVAPGTIVRFVDGYQLAYWAAGIDPPTIGYISYDAGQTWQEYQPRVRTAEAVPDGVIPRPYCQTDYPTDEEFPEIGPGEDYGDVADAACDTLRVGWRDPQTGDQLVLRDNPRAAGEVTVGYDGSIWAGGYDSYVEGEPAGDYRLSVSRDRGRTWQDATPAPPEGIDEPASADRRWLFAAANGDTAYLVSAPWSGEGASRLYRTADGGETWQPLPAGQPFSNVMDLWVARDGALVVKDHAADPTPLTEVLYLSRDGGQTFDARDLPAMRPEQIAGGFYGYALDLSTKTAVRALSADGLTWRAFEVPQFRPPR